MSDRNDTGSRISVVPPQEESGREQDLRTATNPDPRANENLVAAPGKEASKGAGSEVTDGEAG